MFPSASVCDLYFCFTKLANLDPEDFPILFSSHPVLLRKYNYLFSFLILLLLITGLKVQILVVYVCTALWNGENYAFADLLPQWSKRPLLPPCSLYYQKPWTTLQAAVTANFLLYNHFSYNSNGLEGGKRKTLNGRLFYEEQYTLCLT